MTRTESYLTRGGIRVHRTVTEIPVANAIEPVIAALDAHRGVLLASSYEYPGRYTRWDMGFIDPPLALTARERHARVEALNARGAILLDAIESALRARDAIAGVERGGDALAVAVKASTGRFAPRVHRPVRPR
jgi:anthranilate synthase